MSQSSLIAIIDNLIVLSKQLLSTDADYILVLEEYSRRLNEVEPKLVELKPDPDLKAKLKKLEAQHAKVMLRVQQDQGSILEELKGLKKKGKAIITYTDQLPKRISLGTKIKI